jgi:hypothetical protein
MTITTPSWSALKLRVTSKGDKSSEDPRTRKKAYDASDQK